MGHISILWKLHDTRKRLGFDYKSYTQILKDEFGVQSARDLSLFQISRLIDYLENHKEGKHGKGKSQS